MSAINFGEMCNEASERLYLEHYGVKGMKWGIRRYQNLDGTLTAEGKERYRSVFDGGKSKAADEFYRKVVSKDSEDNWRDLRSSLPVQHAVSKLSQDNVKYYEHVEETNRKFEEIIRRDFDSLSDADKRKWEDKARDASYEFRKKEYDDDDVELSELMVMEQTDYFDNPKRGFTINDYEMEHPGGFLFTAIGQWYASNKGTVQKELKPWTDIDNANYDAMIANCRNYIQEFTKGFGQFELKDLSSKEGRPVTADDKLERIVRDTFNNYMAEYGSTVVTMNYTQQEREKYLEDRSKMFENWRKEAFKNSGFTKLY